jgi:hypothetical protein
MASIAAIFTTQNDASMAPFEAFVINVNPIRARDKTPVDSLNSGQLYPNFICLTSYLFQSVAGTVNVDEINR